jgi:hypothetical protein
MKAKVSFDWTLWIYGGLHYKAGGQEKKACVYLLSAKMILISNGTDGRQ